LGVSCLGLWKDDLSSVLLAEEVEEVLVEAGVLRVVGRHLYNKICKSKKTRLINFMKV
jgi:hypothetical protein